MLFRGISTKIVNILSLIMKLRVIILSQSSVMEYRNPHLAVLAAAKDGLTDCCSEGFAGPKAVQDIFRLSYLSFIIRCA